MAGGLWRLVRPRICNSDGRGQDRARSRRPFDAQSSSRPPIGAPKAMAYVIYEMRRVELERCRNEFLRAFRSPRCPIFRFCS